MQIIMAIAGTRKQSENTVLKRTFNLNMNQKNHFLDIINDLVSNYDVSSDFGDESDDEHNDVL